jgi:hypothetical protein
MKQFMNFLAGLYNTPPTTRKPPHEKVCHLRDSPGYILLRYDQDRTTDTMEERLSIERARKLP